LEAREAVCKSEGNKQGGKGTIYEVPICDQTSRRKGTSAQEK